MHTQSISHWKYKSNSKADLSSCHLGIKKPFQVVCMVWHNFDLSFYLLYFSCHFSASSFIIEILIDWNVGRTNTLIIGSLFSFIWIAFFIKMPKNVSLHGARFLFFFFLFAFYHIGFNFIIIAPKHLQSKWCVTPVWSSDGHLYERDNFAIPYPFLRSKVHWSKAK